MARAIAMAVHIAVRGDVTILLRRLVFVRVLAIHHVRGYEMVQYPRYELDANDAPKETADEDPRGLFRGEATVY